MQETIRSCEGLHDCGVRRLGVEVGIEEERVRGCPPGVLHVASCISTQTGVYARKERTYGVADTPDGDGDTLGHRQASLRDGGVVVGTSVDDVEL